MTLDSAIAESGLDSLERMEILATLEERFGGRFPPEILPELETTRQVIAAVEKYLGGQPRAALEQDKGKLRGRDPAGNLQLRTVSRVPAASAAARHAGEFRPWEPLFWRA